MSTQHTSPLVPDDPFRSSTLGLRVGILNSNDVSPEKGTFQRSLCHVHFSVNDFVMLSSN